MTSATWLVLGAGSPIARAFANQAADRGHTVLLAGRDVHELEPTAADIQLRTGGSCIVLPFDAEAFDDHAAFVERCTEVAEGTLNIFLAFGAMPPQEDIDRDFSLAQRTVNANYLGAVSVLSRLAPVLEQQRTGRIVVLGSTAGDRGRLKNYVYGSAKAGLHAYLQGLRARLFRAGVSVTTVKPGFVDTRMTWGQPKLFLVASPERLAAACLRYADKGADVRYYPWFWAVIMTIIRAVPERLFKRLNI